MFLTCNETTLVLLSTCILVMSNILDAVPLILYLAIKAGVYPEIDGAVAFGVPSVVAAAVVIGIETSLNLNASLSSKFVLASEAFNPPVPPRVTSTGIVVQVPSIFF